jgi:hypothetical protein
VLGQNEGLPRVRETMGRKEVEPRSGALEFVLDLAAVARSEISRPSRAIVRSHPNLPDSPIYYQMETFRISPRETRLLPPILLAESGAIPVRFWLAGTQSCAPLGLVLRLAELRAVRCISARLRTRQEVDGEWVSPIRISP